MKGFGLYGIGFLLLVVAVVACGGGSSPATATPTSEPTSTATPDATATPSPTVEPTPTASPSPTLDGALAILGGTLIDGTGAEPITNSYVFIANGQIQDVGCCADLVDVPEGYEIVDASGLTVMPGLVDGHVHVARNGGVSPAALESFLNSGFTIVRDVAAPPGALPAAALEAEALDAAPTVVWAGPMVTTAGGYPLSVPRYADVGRAVASVEEAVALVDDLEDAGARLVKLGLDRGYYSDEGWSLLGLDIVSAITGRAHEHGMRVTAHVTSLDEVRLALDGGVDDVAHAPLELIPDDLMAEMLDADMGMVTTATVWGMNQDIAALNAMRYANVGGTVSIGTDYGCCGQTPGLTFYLRELLFLRSAGMTLEQLITAATRGGAVVANLADETGTLESGKRADMLLVDGDPLVDVGALRNVATVIKGGTVVVER